jgi:S-adenosylmethionine decarboxylase proenzyme
VDYPVRQSALSLKKGLGRHLLLELYNCDRKLLNQVEPVENILKKTAIAANATIIESAFHHFSPYGVSGVVVISESHLTIHTWPEYGYAAVDVFSCDTEMNMVKIEKMLVSAFKAEFHERSLLNRGKKASL